MVSAECFRALRAVYEYMDLAEHDGYMDSQTNWNQMHPSDMKTAYLLMSKAVEEMKKDMARGEFE